MRLDLDPAEFPTKDAFVRAALALARDLASAEWEETHKRHSNKLTKEIDRLSKQELARRLLRLMTRPARRRAVIDDGMRFIANCTDKFDVIISDCPDPTGPGEVLFSEDFYHACHRCLTDDGILVAQNGTPFLQIDEVKTTAKNIQGLFADWHFYMAAVPTYIGGSMTFAWGSTDADYRKLSLETLRQRYAGSSIVTRYYNPEIHQGAFALPQYVLQAVNKPSND